MRIQKRVSNYNYCFADYYGDGGLDSGTGGVGGGGGGVGGGGTGGSSHFRPDPLGSDSSFHGHGRPPYTPIGRHLGFTINQALNLKNLQIVNYN